MHIFKTVKERFSFLSKLNDILEREDKINFFIVLISTLFSALFQALGVASILPFINMVMNPNTIFENNWLQYFYSVSDLRSISSFIVLSGFVVLGLLIIGNLISAFSIWLKINFVWKINHRISSSLLKKYLSLPYSFFLDKNTSLLGGNVLMEVQHLTSGILQPIIDIVSGCLITIVIISLLLYVNPLTTIVSATILITSYLFIYFYYSRKIRGEGEIRSKENSERFKSANEALGGIKDIKLLGVETYFLHRYVEHSSNFSRSQAWYMVIGILPKYFMETVAFGGVVGLMIFLVYFNKSTQETIPLVSFFAFAGFRMMPALQDIFYAITTLKFNNVVLDKIYKDLNENNSLRHKTDVDHKKSMLMPFNKEIEFKNLYYSYPNSKKLILKDINFKIKKNTYVALIGSTGSGKTTLVDLLLGLLSPQKGTIKIDGTKINVSNIKTWQANLGYVPQQIYLSDDTIARNIAFGLPNNLIDMEQVINVSKMANLHGFIEEELPLKYQTVIGERGIRLSGGQRQRIGIARALYHNPSVLIFDEATSSLDNATEIEVLSAIEGIAKLKTMIVIAHRLTTVKNCDIVYKIEKGMIVDKGNYENMIVNIKKLN